MQTVKQDNENVKRDLLFSPFPIESGRVISCPPFDSLSCGLFVDSRSFCQEICFSLLLCICSPIQSSFLPCQLWIGIPGGNIPGRNDDDAVKFDDFNFFPRAVTPDLGLNDEGKISLRGT